MKFTLSSTTTLAALFTATTTFADVSVNDQPSAPSTSQSDAQVLATADSETVERNDLSRAALSLAFVRHIDEDMAEQDVFYEKEIGSNLVWRPTAATRDLNAPLYAPAEPVAHNFLDTTDIGPYPKGKPLGITVGDWLAARGEGNYTCRDGQGEIELSFTNLVSDSVYTLWHDFTVWPPTEPFIGTYDLPFGARDGSENVFTTNAEGNAQFAMTFAPCLQLSGEHLLSDLAIAWHSDSKTHGPLPGEFSTNTHVHLYVTLPKRNGA